MKRQPAHPCPTCHGFARAKTADGRIACTRCGTILPPLPYGERSSALSHQTPLRVGMTAQIGGKEFVAVGRIRYTQTEEGETYTWEEWVLLHPDGDAQYLEYDEGKWTLTEPFQPGEAPTAGEFSIAQEGARYQVDGQSVTVTDAGACRVAGVEGEIPWPVAKGDGVRYIDMEAGSALYSAEITDDEVEWFRGRRLDDRAVFTLFDLRDLIAAQDRREQALKGRRFFGILCLLAGVLALIVWGVARGRGQVVAQGSAPLASIPPDGARFGPYTLTAAGRVHRLRVSSDLSQSAAWVQAVIEDDAGDLFNAGGEFWDERGHDNEGAWHEYNLQAQSDFLLSQPGNVYVRVYAEPEAAGGSGGNVSFIVEQGVLYPPYLATFGTLSLLLGGGFLIASSPEFAKGVWNSMSSS